MRCSPPTLMPLLLCAVGCTVADPPVAGPTENTEPAPVVVDPLGALANLSGAWVDSGPGHRYLFLENWYRESDSVLVGRGSALRGTDTVFVEDLKLVRNGEQLHYAVRLGSPHRQDWVTFTAIASSSDTVEFENPGHDFPQCITYVRSSEPLEWAVRLTGMENGSERTDQYTFSPIRND